MAEAKERQAKAGAKNLENHKAGLDVQKVAQLRADIIEESKRSREVAAELTGTKYLIFFDI